MEKIDDNFAVRQDLMIFTSDELMHYAHRFREDLGRCDITGWLSSVMGQNNGPNGDQSLAMEISNFSGYDLLHWNARAHFALMIFSIKNLTANSFPFITERELSDLMQVILANMLSVGPAGIIFVDNVPTMDDWVEPFIIRCGHVGNLDCVESFFKKFGPMLKVARTGDRRLREIESIYRKSIGEIVDDRKISILLCGPGEPSTETNPYDVEFLVYALRQQLKKDFERSEMIAVYGEELTSVGCSKIERSLNPMLKEKIFALKADITVILASSPGSVAELGAFSQFQELASKMVFCVLEDHINGFATKGPGKDAQNFGASFVTFGRVDLTTGVAAQQILDAVIGKVENCINTKIRENQGDRRG